MSPGSNPSLPRPLARSLSSNALEVLRSRYLIRDARGTITETADEMFRRVARAIAQPHANYGATTTQVKAVEERFYRRMSALEFLPNSPTLMNAGRSLGQLAACFVVPVGDSTEDIFRAVGWAASIQKTGGGTGFDFSQLRPAGDLVESTGGRASGPVAFMQVFDVATGAVKQGGVRRGANMGILRVDHPDILEFIGLKLDPAKMSNFNLSVAITDAFMRALDADQGAEPATGQKGCPADYALISPRTAEPVRTLSARRVWDALVNAAWSIGDPGLIFIDRINRDNPTPELGAISATNPCGEQPLLGFESCTLGSINLGVMVRDGAIDWPHLTAVIRDGVDFLDNVVDANRYPLPAIASATRATRKLGLGVMGFADMLIELGLAYDDPRAVIVAGEIAHHLEAESLTRSEELAELRGCFPAWRGSIWAERGRALRNATTTTVAPTGTLSIIAGCSSGIEPLFAVAYRRRVLDGRILLELHPGFRARAEAAGLWSDDLAAALASRGAVRGLRGVPEDLQALFPTSHDVPIATHVAMQAAFQRHVHAAVSKTINLPADATPGDVDAAYRAAFELGCKGVTVYRDGSRASQVLSFGDSTGTDSTAGKSPGTDHASESISETDAGACPSCAAELDQELVYRQQGCVVCRNCGWSVCG